MTKFLLVLLTASACWVACTDLPAAQTAPVTVSTSTAEQVAREEMVRRQAAQLTAEKSISEGEKLYSAGKYAEAAAKFEDANKSLPRAPATEGDYNRVVRGLTDSYTRLAEAAFRSGDNTNAVQLARKALQYQPDNSAAQDIVVKVKRIESGTGAGAAGTTLTGGRPDQAPEFTAKKDQIKQLFREGKILMNSGQYDEAERRFQQVLLLDAYNEDASLMLKSVDKMRMEIAENAADATRVHRLWEVSDSWTPPISRDVQPPKSESATGSIGSEALRQQKITEKLNKIIIPEINYREAVVSDVITFLSEESRRLDPEKVGVNIVLGGGVAAPLPTGAPKPATAPAPPPAADAGAAGSAPAGEGETFEGRKITLSLRDVPLVDALKYVTTLANLKYRVESSAVVVLPIDAPSGDMVMRSYAVNPGAIRSSIVITNYGAVTTASLAVGGGGGGAAQASPLTQTGPSAALPQVSISVLSNDVRQMFVDAGVEFPTNSTLFFNERTSVIIVRNTIENLESFERVLATFNTIPKQVEIEAKFVELSQNDLDELGFDWQVGTKQLGSFDATGGSGAEAFPPGSGGLQSSSFDVTPGLRGASVIQANAIESLLAGAGFGSVAQSSDQIGTIRGILTNPQFQLIIKALSQKQSADVLSAPKVTTISGVMAQIRVAQEFIYPTTFTPPTATAAGGGTTGGGAAAVTPSIPTAFASRSVGVVFNVTPMVGADGYTIALTLIPQVTDFLGFINYGGPISLAAGNNVVTTFNDIKQPLFSTRDVVTSVEIWDGQTVVLGGLISENLQKIDDKVPFLGDIPMVGRLFRTKTTVRNKRNLLIFVTARLIDPAGNPIHRMPLTASTR